MKKIILSTISLVLVFSLAIPSVSAKTIDDPAPSTAELAEHVPGELLVRFSPGMNPAQIKDKMNEMGVIHKRVLEGIDVHLVKLPPGLSVDAALDRFSHMPGVKFAEPNYIVYIAETSQGDISDQWGLTQIHTQEAWDILSSNQKNEILLATVDTGVKRDVSDLVPNIWADPDEIPNNGIDDDGNGYIDDTWGWDFVNNDNNPTDDHMHGSAVTGVMVAAQDGIGVVGICPWCKVMAVKVLGSQGSGSLDIVASGITYAAQNGARVINLSLAGPADSATLKNAVDFAWNNGAVVVAAGGNDGTKTMLYPAGYANAMAVASTNLADKHSCFSNYSPGYISVAAPGQSIYVVDINDVTTGYNYYSGTSLSAPHVSGLAGLILGKDPSLTNVDVRAILENSAVDLGPIGFDAAFGYGRIDAYRAITDDDLLPVFPPDSLSSMDNTATGYAHARKLVRDDGGTLHLIWHTEDSSGYRIRYATSNDNGVSWAFQSDVFNSPYETYHPALAIDDEFLYVAIPSRGSDSTPYQILFTRKPVSGGSWSSPVVLMGGTYNAVRPDIFVDPSNGRVHLIASSWDDDRYLYYKASNTQGADWEISSTFNPSNTSTNFTRYAAIHAYGNNVYVVARTVEKFLGIPLYLNMFTVRSANGGLTWIEQTHISANPAVTSGEYGISLAGVGNRVYMGYEVGTSLYFRRNDGAGWSNYLTLEPGDANNIYKWPTITQAEDGQAWMIFGLNGQLYMRHYDGVAWSAKEYLSSGSYANLKLGTGGEQVEWVSTICNGSPFDLAYDSLSLGVNMPPQAADQIVSTDEDIPLLITLAGSDPDGDALTYAVISQPSHGILSGVAPSLLYTPDYNYHGSDSFTFVANDGKVDSMPARVSITLTPVNDSPVADDQAVTIAEDTTKSITLTASDVDGDSLTYTLVGGPAYGTLSGSAPNPTYTPNPNYNGPDSFTFKANDGQADGNIATVSITVDPVNDPPVADDQAVNTEEDTPTTIILTASDVDSAGLSYIIVNGPANGVLSGAAPNLTYTPSPGFNGSDSFTFKASDGQLDSNIVTVSITVTPAATSVESIATGEIFVAGTVSGNYTYTHSDSGNVEFVTERVSGGKPQNRYSYLEHKWIFNVTPGNTVTLYANAWSGGSSDGDDFIFAYSTNDSNYITMFTVSNTSDAGYMTYVLPASIQGTVYVRVADSNRSGGSSLDTINVDHLYIRSEMLPGDPPAAPTGLSAIATAATQIDLAWADNSNTESGFYIERSLNGTDWAQIATVGANDASYADTTVSPDATYYYRVRAFNAYGASGYSDTASATTDPLSMEMMQVSSLVDSSDIVRNKWNATVQIVVSASGGQIANAVVTGLWSDGTTGTAECTTGSNGQCIVTKDSIKTSIPSVTFTVTSVVHSSYIYDPENSIVTVVVYQK